MPFAVPMIWREPTNHSSDCYFCMVDICGYSSKTKSGIVYPDIPSAIKPVPHSDLLPVPLPPDDDCSTEEDSSTENPSSSTPSVCPYSTDSPHLIKQGELNDLVRELSLSKQHSELLASRLKEWNLLACNTQISIFRTRHKKFADFYEMANSVCFCNDINGLMQALACPYVPEEWRLFIDASKISLKGVLLHNGNIQPAIPVAHAAGMKESYESMQVLLNLVKYQNHQWSICGDFKVIALILGMQGGYTKHSCFLCLWDSRDDANHYQKKEWPKRDVLIPGKQNVKYAPLIEPSKVLLPPLHIKLGLMKNFVKALDEKGRGFKYLREKFPKLTEAKVKAGVFVVC
jgi:hypothetical protein